MQDVGFKTFAILQLKLKQLLQDNIADFNMQMFYISSLLYNPCEDGFNKTVDNMLEDFQMLRLIICFCFNILSESFLLTLTLAGI